MRVAMAVMVVMLATLMQVQPEMVVMEVPEFLVPGGNGGNGGAGGVTDSSSGGNGGAGGSGNPGGTGGSAGVKGSSTQALEEWVEYRGQGFLPEFLVLTIGWVGISML